MLDPSSSEDEGDEILDSKEVTAQKSLGGARLSPGRAADSHGGGGLQPRGRGSGGGGRPSSPSPSVGSDKEKEDLEKMQREEEERKKRLQLYVFVMRCIAYPFNAKQPTDMARRQQKVRAASEKPKQWPKLQFPSTLHLCHTSHMKPTVASTLAPCCRSRLGKNLIKQIDSYVY